MPASASSSAAQVPQMPAPTMVTPSAFARASMG
jgi:hypothetical protein